MPKLVFTSYATVNHDEHLNRFVKELAREVLQHLETAKPEDVAFFAVDQIESGEYWRDRLAAELTNCKACVAICTPAFFASTFCGKEVRVILQRLEQWQQHPASAQVTQRPVFPVLWVTVKVPDVLEPFQNREGGFPPEYEGTGLRTMYKLAKYAQRRTEVVLTLAERIAAAIKAVDLPASAAIPHFDFIGSAFHDEENPVRHGVAFVPFVKGGIHAKPYAQGGTLGSMLEAACGTQVPARLLEQDQRLVARLTAAREGQEVTVVITDLETLADPLYQSVVAAIDGELRAPAAVLVRRAAAAGSDADEQNAAITIKTAFQTAIAKGTLVDWTTVRAAQMLQSELARVILKLRESLMSAVNPVAARDEDLAANAAREGIPTAQPGTLAVPGKRIA